MNPFAKAPSNPFQPKQPNGVTTPAVNPFLAKPNPPNPFLTSTSTSQSKPAPTAFGQPSGPTPKSNPFAKPSNAQDFKPIPATTSNSSTTKAPRKQQSPFSNGGEPSTKPSVNGERKVANYVQPAWKPSQKDAGSAAGRTKAAIGQSNGKRKSENDYQRQSKFSRKSPDSEAAPTPFGAPQQNKVDTFSKNKLGKPRNGGDRNDFAKQILAQLAKDNIKPPRWPENPGSHASRQAIERYRETYKVYRERARKSLTRAGLIDDPDKKRRLDEALVFKGICQEMCPEWEKITRIVEHDIRGPEKGKDERGELVAMPELMVKRLARSAAGQDAPLPMDVRSVATLRWTLDYLIDELIPSDDELPQRHSYLWDRTRAIRIDFSFQKYAMTPDETKDQVYCLETIARFHVTSLHLLSQDGFTPSDFSEQQEVEQLGKTLISLMEVYDDCMHQGISCENEAEFRGYFIIFNAHNPALMEMIEGWESRFGSSIQSAIGIVECIENTRQILGPLYPETASQMAIDAISIFFDVIACPEVSYTMACFAEIHFNSVRKGILKVIKKAYSRPRFGPKDLTPKVLKKFLRTDTEEEAAEFFRKHGLKFDEQDGYLVLLPGVEFTEARIPHSFSGDIVERKRSGRSLPTIIHETVFELGSRDLPNQDSPTHSPEESLFVSDSQNEPFASINNSEQQQHDNRIESNEPTPAFSRPDPASSGSSMFGNHVATKPTPSTSFGQPSTSAIAQLGKGDSVGSSNPFLSSATSTSSGLFTSTSQLNKTTAIPPSGSVASNMMPAFLEGAVSKSHATDDRGSDQEHAESSKAQSALSTQTIKFGDDVSKQSINASQNNVSTGLFNLFNDNSKNKEAVPPDTQSSSPFSGLLPTNVELSNKDGPQLSGPLGPSTTLGPQPLPMPATSASSQFPTQSTSALSSDTSVQGDPALNPNHTPTLFQQQVPGSSEPNIQGSSHSFLNKAPTNTNSTLSSQQSGSTSTSVPTKTTKNDPMDNFSRWFVCADRGLMESQLEQFAVEHILKNIWDGFQASEAERIRKEEDEASWAAARKFREYSLKVKYYYRWHEGFRKRARLRRMKLENEKARQWRLPENVAKREREEREAQEKVLQEAKESILGRSRQNVDKTAKLRSSTRSSSMSKVQQVQDSLARSHLNTLSPESSTHSIEEALLATGVFSGMRDERAAARYAARGYGDEVDSDRVQEKKMKLRSENHRRVKRGLPPLKSLPEPKVHKEGSKTAMVRALCSGAGRDTMSMSTGSLRNSTFSSSYRSSLGYNSSRVSKPRPTVTDPYWRLKANGLVRMPNGEYLHESIAIPMLKEGKRIPGFGDYGLPPVKPSNPNLSQSPPPALPLSDFSSPHIRNDDVPLSPTGSSPLDAESQKRKRNAEDEDFASIGRGSPAIRKRAKSGDDDQNFLDDIASLLNRVDSIRNSTSKEN